MLVDHNIFTWALINFGVFLYGYLGLGCFIYFLVALFSAGVPGISHPFSIAVESLGALEILWYLIWFLPYKQYLGRPHLAPDTISREERFALFRKLTTYIPDLPLFVRGWFDNAHLDEIYREEVKDWLLWAFWNRQGFAGEDDEELEEMIEEIEEKTGVAFRKGRAGARAIRLSLDPISMRHASLFWYLTLGVLDFSQTLWLMVRGFKFYRQPRMSYFTNFPPRPMTLLSLNASAAPEFSYFYRPHKSSTRRPLVFLHGIGMGLFPYLAFFEHIPHDVGILAVEFQPVSGRICPQAVAQRDFVSAIRKIVSQQNLDDFVLMGHSYGTLMCRSLLEDPIVSSKIHSLILCDPASLMTHLPDLAYNIARRKPSNAPQLEMKWFAAGDPRTAHTLTRRLNWQDCIIWRETFVDKRTTVIIGERDCVISPLAAASYIYYGHVEWTSHDVEEWKKTPETWTGLAELELMFLADRDHGQSLMAPQEMKRVGAVVDKYTHRDSAEPEVPWMTQVMREDNRGVSDSEKEVVTTGNGNGRVSGDGEREKASNNIDMEKVESSDAVPVSPISAVSARSSPSTNSGAV